MLYEFEAFSRDCAFEAGVISGNVAYCSTENSENNNIKNGKIIDCEPLEISTKKPTSTQKVVKTLVEKSRSNKHAILYISSNYSIEVSFYNSYLF